jgi:hypothetical protein
MLGSISTLVFFSAVAGAKPWDHPPTLDELMGGTRIAGVQFRSEEDGKCVHRASMTGDKPGLKGFHPRDLDKAVAAGAITSYRWEPRDGWVKIALRGGEGYFLDDRHELTVELPRGDFEALHFRFDSSDGETAIVDAIIAYPRWDGGLDRDDQLAALGLEPTQEDAVISAYAGMVLRTQRATHRVLLAPDDNEQPWVRAVVWQCHRSNMHAMEDPGDIIYDLARAEREDRRGEMRKWYPLISVWPTDKLERYVRGFRETLGDELGVIGTLQARFDQASGFLEKLNVLGLAYTESKSMVCKEDRLGLDRAALAAEADSRLAAAEGMPAAVAGWGLVKAKLEQRCDEETRQALGMPLVDLQRQVIALPIVESTDPYIGNMAYKAREEVWSMPVHSQLMLDYKAGAGPAPVLTLGTQRPQLTSRTFEDSKTYRKDETTRAWTVWKASLDHQEHLYRMATEEMERRSQFLSIYTAYASGACWETEQAHWYDVVREVDCTGWGRSESWTEVDTTELAAFERAVHQREWVISEANKLIENEPDKGERYNYSCDREVQEWSGTVEQSFSVSVGGDVVQRGSEIVEIEPVQLLRNVRCSQGGARDVDQWVESAAELAVDPVGLKDLVEPIGESAREGVRAAIGRNLVPQLQGRSAEEAAWLRWMFGQEPEAGDEAHLPLEFLAAW